MNLKRLVLMALALGALVPSRAAFSQTDDAKALRKDMEALKEGQQAIQKDIQEIKKLLAARPTGARRSTWPRSARAACQFRAEKEPAPR